jgi:glucose/arabinose dehydrogenase
MKPSTAFAFVLLIGLNACDSQAQFELEPAFPNLSFNRPVDLQHPADGTGRLFVVEQPGVIKVFENSSATTTAEVFLDIRDRVLFGGEQGLLGLAFHPQFQDNGFFYVDYTAADPRRTVIARYRVDPNNPNRADKNSELVVLEVLQPFTNHNGGQITFGADGFLYIALGDGGSAGDPEGNAQNRKTLLGSILRIDVDNPSGDKNYGIPEDNPFVNNSFGFREEIYAYGLRNPWRFSFDPVTGWLWAADVGQNKIEEIDLIEKGKNYGWNILEGTSCFDPPSGCDTTGLEPPIWEYDHSLGQSVTGGFVYRGPGVPELVGAYIYGDFISGRIWSLRYDGSGEPQNTELLNTDLSIASFGIDADNELYICAFDGKIYRFKPTVTSVEQSPTAPEAGLLAPNYPNPFNPATTIAYALSTGGHVNLSIYDLAGRLVQTLVRGYQAAGQHTVEWDGTDQEGILQSSGVYVYLLRLGGRTVTSRRMVLMR